MEDSIPTFNEIARIAPLTAIVLLVLFVGVGIAYYLMIKHIESLKSFIEYLKGDGQ